MGSALLDPQLNYTPFTEEPIYFHYLICLEPTVKKSLFEENDISNTLHLSTF